MFTGIVEEVGAVDAVQPRENGIRLSIRADRAREGLDIGDSIAVDGVCQTVVALQPGGFAVDVIATTLSRTTLGAFRPGRRVNLERALALGDRLGGHLVQGHVDAVGRVAAYRQHGDHVLLDIEVPVIIAEVAVPHGAIAVNGVSLTINALPAPGAVQVALIPHTREHTNLSALAVDDRVNLEGDMLGKFVVHYLRRLGTPGGAGG